MEVMPQSQVVLLQPVLSNGTSCSPKAGSGNMQQSKCYTPILKSYPRIAPYPVNTPSKRVGTRTQAQAVSNFEAATNKVQVAESQEQDFGKSLTAPAESNLLATITYKELRTVPDNSSMPAEEYQDLISMHSNKLKRFSNTYNILNKSGLLGITLRTKQLIKENKRTQGQLHLLQEQTALLLEALSSGDPQLWTKLQVSLQETEKEQFEVKTQSVLT
ncbi:hypothetical protein XENOCAPTIV_030565 [Xenoophorus captivus]|uniref:Uncharacterized protein n=1 Tax=Xenoophorus captivus TaxID=1517983 RepID=A0ABV0RVW3_9TELE